MWIDSVLQQVFLVFIHQQCLCFYAAICKKSLTKYAVYPANANITPCVP